ncbi:pyridoxal-dependent decarboxylase [Aliivibrio sp. SR45-2]|uniref:pyridoxal phosphate-dependent decarboxylase family protein n=1 Tax=Aliivibrio sp. SR45-2 TaxID=2760931 RepID=UPI0015FD1F11|nr:pyridoxal-dependent decarboxylase [Aliivibrio sp. SR45-2]MBB1313002.1 pyridoxal-dependent decarboxylase [Aliivibrio sp. SR45-2]
MDTKYFEKNANNDTLFNQSSLLSNVNFFDSSSLEHYKEITELGLNTLIKTVKETSHPNSGISPEELKNAFKNIDLDSPLIDINDVVDELDELYLKHAVYFHHKDYLAHLNCPVLLTSLLAEQISCAINTAVETWDQSAGGTFIEQKVIDWLAYRIGYLKSADGVFTTGGTQSNLMALLLAREQCNTKLDNTKKASLPTNTSKFRILCSEYSHYSIQKAAFVLGLGQEAVISVPANAQRQMDPTALSSTLASLVEQGLIPMAVVATAGTTDFGSIDPIEEIASLCQQYQCWLHVDAAYGGVLLISNKFPHLLKSIEQADSVSIDFHKSFFQPLCCSALMVSNGQSLSHLTYHADYLNPKHQADNGIPDLANKSLQTSRRFDALKIWLTLRACGPEAIGKLFDDLILNTQEVYQRSQHLTDIKFVQEPQLTTLVFRFVDQRLTPTEQDTCNRAIREALSKSRRALIAATVVNGRQYLKITMLNPQTPVDSIVAVFEAINTCGHSITEQLLTNVKQSA